MKSLSSKDLLLVGLTLFSMFFGAGNLIFPPFLGFQAGENVWPAVTGFALSAIGIPIMGVAAVSISGSLKELAGRVNKYFALIFTILSYLSIGPGLAIPRTASTSFEMAVAPFLTGGFSLSAARVLYSVLFFGVALLLSMRPDKLTERLGKILTPCLLILILIVFAGSVVSPAGSYGPSYPGYNNNPFAAGFLGGYQTMDAIAALNFGILIAMNVKAKGVKDQKGVVKETIKAGVIAGIVLLLVYSALAYIGNTTGMVNQQAENGAAVLTYAAGDLYGRVGVVLMGIIFFIACLNTCVGLISSCGEFFSSMVPGISYRKWSIIFAVLSFIIANLGLNKILEVSIPILNAIYPVAIVLIILSFLNPWIGKFPYSYSTGILATGIVSIVSALEQSNIRTPVLAELVSGLPLYGMGFPWVIPAIIGSGAGVIISVLTGKMC